ncbi:MAG: bifunctional 4-hydroxy-2-oxoglutarate aldolase/2-dehydro-3-deoxy-phosphogluconate aldolase [Comamonas sp.]|nr:bifunctional 4-hydroxy-2-oxoglutarate aldolase/2-dehydro-3-deoxy-phosphogluconate aldolase [Comamonas sp.]
MAEPLSALRIMQDAPVIPVIVVNDLSHAIPMAEALMAGGVRVLEITLRTPQGLKAISAIAKALPEAWVGVGTVRSAQDAQDALNAGARFAVSPGYTSALGQKCRAIGLPLLPGVATGSEIMTAQADGYQQLKFFPAVQAGGLNMLKAWQGPFGDVQFCPTGGISMTNAADFLALANVECVGGSWLVPNQALQDGDWKQITQLAQQACTLKA